MRQAMRWGVGVLVAVPLCLGAVGEKAAASRPVPAVEGINGKPAPQGEKPVFRLSRAQHPGRRLPVPGIMEHARHPATPAVRHAGGTAGGGGRRGCSFEAIDAGKAIPACLTATRTISGEPRFAAWLGRSYSKGNQHDEAARWYRKAADQGYADAGNVLVMMFQAGLVVPKDGEEAIRWFQQVMQKRTEAAKEPPKAQEQQPAPYDGGRLTGGLVPTQIGHGIPTVLVFDPCR